MKRYKLFLGATTAVLAIAGIAATKAARLTAQTTYFYCTTSAIVPFCYPFNTLVCGSNFGILCRTRIFGPDTPLYTIYLNGDIEPVPCGPFGCTIAAHRVAE